MFTQEDCDTVQQEEEQLEEEVEKIDQDNDLEEQPPEFDIDEVTPSIEVDELIAEYEMHAHELEDFLPPDTIFTFEEEGTEAEDFHEDIDDSSVDTISIDQDMLVLEVKVEVQEVEEEELETYELIDTEQEIQEEALDQQEVNISIENDIWEEVEEDTQILEEDQDIELSNINQAIEELTAEVEVTELEILQLEKELETIIEEEGMTEQAGETENEGIEELEGIKHQEESQIEENGNVGDTEWEYEESEEQDYCDQETLDSDTSDSTSVEATEYEKTTIDQEFEEIPVNELEYQTDKEEIEELEELEETFEIDEIEKTLETVETANNVQSVKSEDEVQSQQSIIPSEEAYSLSEMIDIENTSIQPSSNISLSQSIEIGRSDDIPQQQSFGLSFDERFLHNFSINSLDTEISALEKMLEEVEAPRLLEQFHTRMEEDLQQLLDVETPQTIPKLADSLELVSQGPTLPEPPPYNFREELEEWEEEAEEQAQTTHGKLLRSFEKARQIQLAASYNFARKNQKQVRGPRKSEPLELKKDNLVKVDGKEINDGTNCSVIKSGKMVLSGSIQEINRFINSWNGYVSIGGIITEEMWNIFNGIQDRFTTSMRAIKVVGEKEWRLHLYIDLINNLEDAIGSGGDTNRLIEQILFMIDKIHITKSGINPNGIGLDDYFIKVDFPQCNDTTVVDRFYIMNRETMSGFNPYGRIHNVFKANRSHLGWQLRNLLLKKVNLSRSRARQILQKASLQIPYSKGVHYKARYPAIFKLKYDAKKIEEVLEYIFLKMSKRAKLKDLVRYDSNGTVIKGHCLANIMNYYDYAGTQIKAGTKKYVSPNISSPFEIRITDFSEVLFDVVRQMIKKHNRQNDLTNEFWNSMKKRYEPQELVELITKTSLKLSRGIETTYNVKEALKAGLGGITDSMDEFWNERRSDSFTRLIAALISDEKVRKLINKKSNLNLPVNVFIDDVIGHDSTFDNVVTVPDSIIYTLQKNCFIQGEAEEFIQVKILRAFSPSYVDRLKPEDYLLDFFKTIGNYDEKSRIGIKRFFIGVLRKGESLGGLTRLAENRSIVIIGFWSNSSTKVERMGDIITAFSRGYFSRSNPIRDNDLLYDMFLYGLMLEKEH